MRSKFGEFGLGLVFVVVGVLVAGVAARAECRVVSVSAAGQEKEAIEAATSSAVDALVAKIGRKYGKILSTGSHRSGQFDCHKNLGGTGGHPTRWTCKATTGEICKVG